MYTIYIHHLWILHPVSHHLLFFFFTRKLIDFNHGDKGIFYFIMQGKRNWQPHSSWTNIQNLTAIKTTSQLNVLCLINKVYSFPYIWLTDSESVRLIVYLLHLQSLSNVSSIYSEYTGSIKRKTHYYPELEVQQEMRRNLWSWVCWHDTHTLQHGDCGCQESLGWLPRQPHL